MKTLIFIISLVANAVMANPMPPCIGKSIQTAKVIASINAPKSKFQNVMNTHQETADGFVTWEIALKDTESKKKNSYVVVSEIKGCIVNQITLSK